MERCRSLAAMLVWSVACAPKPVDMSTDTSTTFGDTTLSSSSSIVSMTTLDSEPTAGADADCQGYEPGEVKDTPQFATPVKGDAELAEYTGVRCLRGGGIAISDVSSLAPLSALERVEGSLQITACPSVTTLADLASLNHVGISFYVSRNPALTSLSGLDSLAFVGDLQIGEIGPHGEPDPLATRGNDLFTDLVGLETLQSVGGILIGDNDSLTSLAGIDHLATATTKYVQIVNNPLLPTATAQGFASLVDDDGEAILVCGNLDGEPCDWVIGD